MADFPYVECYPEGVHQVSLKPSDHIICVECMRMAYDIECRRCIIKFTLQSHFFCTNLCCRCDTGNEAGASVLSGGAAELSHLDHKRREGGGRADL